MISERELRDVVRRVVEANLARGDDGAATPGSVAGAAPAGPAPTAPHRRLALGADDGVM